MPPRNPTQDELLALLDKLPCGGTAQELVTGLACSGTKLKQLLVPLIVAGEVFSEPIRHPATGKPTNVFKRKRND
ncbi:hypothetical protein VC52_gp39 [Pseudomonas phage vB_PaeS_PAO1_Ab18]|uniref:Uncharacterized protein n=1 Tax=Pseudomonas phage vB_PaeS_PAO1_Ab18 TaxID=1548905 RepID=A0A0A1IUM8_9CAUD|nr:hypothetical protein VC52_gp39 [Pseudomonas phage vB_PaeS_PAO1_Ab18]CEF89678.1 hypothetical protein [Pseudomonas phage vB_PaeS_PAO1_Ab18]